MICLQGRLALDELILTKSNAPNVVSNPTLVRNIYSIPPPPLKPLSSKLPIFLSSPHVVYPHSVDSANGLSLCALAPAFFSGVRNSGVSRNSRKKDLL
jgi:hypothetical protein